MNTAAQIPPRTVETTDTAREQWVDVTVRADAIRHVVSITEPNGQAHEYFADDVREVALATQHTRGSAQWCAKYRRLLVPGASRVTGGAPFYKLEPMPA